MIETMKILPDYVTRSDKKIECERKLRIAVKSLQMNYNALLAMEDLGEIPNDPKDITLEWLNNALNGKTDGLQFLPIPAAEKRELEEKWSAIRKKARHHISDIQDVISEFSGIEYIIDSKNNINVTNTEEYLNAVCMVEVPEIAREHFALFLQVEKAINSLRGFENENDLKKFRLEDFLLHGGLNAEKFAEAWVNGAFTKSPLEKKVQVEMQRKLAEKMYV